MTNAKDICPKCQSPLPQDAPGGLCPKCVLGAVGTNAEQGRTGTGDLPSLEQLGAIFPHLEILELIGRGGMGFVFKARQPHLDREVALKLLPEKLGTDPHFAERFTREARFLAKLNHPNIVMVHDFGYAGGFYFLTMEYVEGLNLRQAMRIGKFSPAEALAIVPKICDALQFAHEQGVLHRDIKPENILLDTRGRVKIADFGIAKLLGEDKAAVTLTGTGASLGTPHYMAPEQFENPSQVDHRADIYSLGVVFYEMLTGELPLGRFSAPSQRADLDERIDAIVLRALAKQRELRQKDARELQSEVETVATSAATSTARVPPPKLSLWKRVWSGRWKIATGFSVLFCLFLALVNWRAGKQWERQYWEAVQRQQPSPALTVDSSTLPALESTIVSVTNAGPFSPIDPEALRREEEAIQSARERFEAAQGKHSRGEISDRDLAIANRDLIIAEARGNALKIAKAQYDFFLWDYRELAKNDPHNNDALWKAEQELNAGQHAIELAEAGSNELKRASADLKAAERAWGSVQRRRDLRVEGDGVVTNFLSPETLKKLENDYFYAELRYKRLKQKEETTR